MIDELTYNIRRKLFRDLSKAPSPSGITPANRRCPIASWRPSCRVPAWAAPGCTGPASISASIPLSCGCAATMKNATAKTSSPGYDHRDFGVTYDELEPFFDKAEKVFGTSGTARSIKGKVVGKGAAATPRLDRSDDFPLPAQKNTGRRSCLKKRRWKWGITPITCRRPTPPTPIPTPTARRWARATSAVSAAATPATCTLKPRRT